MANEDLTKMIDALVEQKTFGLDALEGIKVLRDKASDLEKRLKLADGSIESLQKERLSQSASLTAKDATIAEWQKRESELRAREAKINDLEKSAAVELARSTAVTACFDKVFANRTVRETVLNNVPTVLPPSYAGGPSIQSWATETKNVTREEG